jgi:hypothetical protein
MKHTSVRVLRFWGWGFRLIALLYATGFILEVGRRQGGEHPHVNLVGQAGMVFVWLYVASLHFALAATRPGSCRVKGCMARQGHPGRHVVSSSLEGEWWLR